jgi:hypothetical protein
MFRQFLSCVASAALVLSTLPAPLTAQPAPAPVPGAAADQGQGEQFSPAQLESLLAPIALYPDTLLTQLLMATTNPLEIVAASRWLAQGPNRELKGKALEDALRRQPWDPAVKSLVPFPQVLEMLNQQLEWTQQLGYAMQTQESEVFDAIQRLRARAQAAGNLQSTPQQVVRTEPAPSDAAGQPVIAIEPAQPDVVYVPAYDPSQVYGAWPYADLPPVFYAPLPGYGYPGALVTGLVFGAGVAIAAGLWGWARPNWGRYGGVNVNVNRWNNISPNRPWRGPNNGVWRPNNPGFRPGGGMSRPGGPVGRPTRPGGRPPGVPPGGPGQRPGIGQPGHPLPGLPGGPGHRPGFPGAGPGNRPGLPPGAGPGNRPGIPPGAGPGNRPSRPPGAGQGQRPGGQPGAGRPGGGINRPAVRPGGGGGGARPAPPPRRPPAAVSRPSFHGGGGGRPAGGRPAGGRGGGGGRHR